MEAFRKFRSGSPRMPPPPVECVLCGRRYKGTWLSNGDIPRDPRGIARSLRM